ncbi:hypothetical protein OG860_05360 [Streptomyces sp. NBC_00267]
MTRAMEKTCESVTATTRQTDGAVDVAGELTYRLDDARLRR